MPLYIIVGLICLLISALSSRSLYRTYMYVFHFSTYEFCLSFVSAESIVNSIRHAFWHSFLDVVMVQKGFCLGWSVSYKITCFQDEVALVHGESYIPCHISSISWLKILTSLEKFAPNFRVRTTYGHQQISRFHSSSPEKAKQRWWQRLPQIQGASKVQEGFLEAKSGLLTSVFAPCVQRPISFVRPLRNENYSMSFRVPTSLISSAPVPSSHASWALAALPRQRDKASNDFEKGGGEEGTPLGTEPENR